MFKVLFELLFMLFVVFDGTTSLAIRDFIFLSPYQNTVVITFHFAEQ